jgi:polyisoprenoid-binding protein YceI
MRRSLLAVTGGLVLMAPTGAASLRAADAYQVDPAHTAVTFKVAHLGLSWTHGRFNAVSGRFVIDSAEPTQSSFELSLKAESIDTGNDKRDEHLKSPDFFNTKQFPAASFKSTSVKPVQGGLEVTGEFTLHGRTQPITFTLAGGKTAEFPPGVKRTGYSAQFKLKRSDYGMDKMAGAVGDEVYVSISFEGVKS